VYYVTSRRVADCGVADRAVHSSGYEGIMGAFPTHGTHGTHCIASFRASRELDHYIDASLSSAPSSSSSSSPSYTHHPHHPPPPQSELPQSPHYPRHHHRHLQVLKFNTMPTQAPWNWTCIICTIFPALRELEVGRVCLVLPGCGISFAYHLSHLMGLGWRHWQS
jgi:hypothetical protein